MFLEVGYRGYPRIEGICEAGDHDVVTSCVPSVDHEETGGHRWWVNGMGGQIFTELMILHVLISAPY